MKQVIERCYLIITTTNLSLTFLATGHTGIIWQARLLGPPQSHIPLFPVSHVPLSPIVLFSSCRLPPAAPIPPPPPPPRVSCPIQTLSPPQCLLPPSMGPSLSSHVCSAIPLSPTRNLVYTCYPQSPHISLSLPVPRSPQSTIPISTLSLPLPH